VDLARRIVWPVAYYSLQANNQIILSTRMGWWMKKESPFRGGVYPLFDRLPAYALGMIEGVCSRYPVDELFIESRIILRYHSREIILSASEFTEDAGTASTPATIIARGSKSRRLGRRYQWIRSRHGRDAR